MRADTVRFHLHRALRKLHMLLIRPSRIAASTACRCRRTGLHRLIFSLGVLEDKYGLVFVCSLIIATSAHHHGQCEPNSLLHITIRDEFAQAVGGRWCSLQRYLRPAA